MVTDQIHHIDVLLAEDNSNDAKLTMRALTKQHLTKRLFWAKDGQEALDFVFAGNRYQKRNILDHPKVILLDLKMPKYNGMEILEKIKKDERTRSIPVVILTSSREEQDILNCYKLGANSYIVKPVDFDKFMTVIKDFGHYWLRTNQSLK